MELLRAGRAGNLRWLQGKREPGNCWDAYEAPSGTSLVEWIRNRHALAWPEMRAIIEALSQELQKLIEEKRNEKEISLQQIWVDRYGQSKILDFPAELPKETYAVKDWKNFLPRVFVFALQPQREWALPSVPLPEYCRDFVKRLCEDRSYESPILIAKELASMSHRRATISRFTRAAVILLPFLVPVGETDTTCVLLRMSCKSPW